MKAPKIPKKTAGKKGRKKFGIKSFFVLHIEKVFLVLAVLVFLGLVVGGMGGYEQLSWEPGALTQAADQADSHIKNMALQPVEFDEKLRVTPYEQKANWIKRPLESRYYTTSVKWEPTLFPDLVPRSEPEVLAVRKLRAEPGWGAVIVKDDDPRSRIQRGGATMGSSTMNESYGTTGSASSTTKLAGKRWVVLTGLIPIKEQLQIYIDTYADAMIRDPLRDTPIYVGSVVERCEYDPTPGARQNWTEIDAGYAYNAEVEKWGGLGPEQVDSSYIPPAPPVPGMLPAAYPLPPLAQKMFGEEVAYPPDVPLLADSLVETLEQQQDILKQLQQTRPMSTDEMLEQLNRNLGAGTSGGMGTMGGGMTSGGMTSGGMTSGGMDGGYGSSYGGGRATGGMSGGLAAMRTAPKLRYTPPSTIDHYLYRYFDFDVEEGKSYQYRVKLLLLNPNANIDPKYLQSPDMSSKSALVTEVSEPSAPVAVGLLSRVLTKGVKAASKRQPWQEPTVEIMPIHFEIEAATEWVANSDQTLKPGQVANFPNLSSVVPETQRSPGVSGSGDSMTTPSSSPGATRGPQRATGPKVQSFNIVSDVTFIDAYGGFPVEGSEYSPGKALFMEPNGTLMLRDAGRDFDETQKYQKPTAATRRQSGRTGSGSR